MIQPTPVIVVPHAIGKVGYDSSSSLWNAYVGDTFAVDRASLTEAIQYLDRIEKRERQDKMGRHKALLVEWGGVKEVTVTSLSEDDSTTHAWVVNVEGRRTKEPLERLRAFSPSNQNRLKEILAVQAQIASLNETLGHCKTELEPYTVPSPLVDNAPTKPISS